VPPKKQRFVVSVFLSCLQQTRLFTFWKIPPPPPLSHTTIHSQWQPPISLLFRQIFLSFCDSLGHSIKFLSWTGQRQLKSDWPGKELALRPGIKKNLQKVRMNSSKCTQNNGRFNWTGPGEESKNSWRVSVRNVSDEGMMTLDKVGALVWDRRTRHNVWL